MSSFMLKIEQSSKRIISTHVETSDSEEQPVDLATEGESGVPCARLEHDALLSVISHDFDKEEDVGPKINQQLADIVNTRWSTKLNEAKIK